MTMRVAKTFLILCALAALSGCGKKPYWPLEKGNEWVYQEHIRTGSTPTGDLRFVVTSVTGAANARRALIHVFRDNAAEPEQEIAMTTTPEGIYESGRWLTHPDVGSGAFEEEIVNTPGDDNPPFVLLSKPEEGQAWSFSFTRADALSQNVWEYTGQGLVDGRESAAPLAGRFMALRVEWAAVRRDGSGEEAVTYWFARGVGPVKIDTLSLGQSTVLMLKKAKIGKKKIGKW